MKQRESFKKTLSPGNFDSIRAEVEGLEAIRQTGCIRVPRVIDHGVNDREAYLVTEFISQGSGSRASSEKLGRQLANMHMHDASSFVSGGKYGFSSDNFIGASPQLNGAEDSWITFFAEKRLRPQLEWAAHYFTADEISNMEALIEHLDKYLPEPDRASLLHGDLWAGNYLIATDGEPVLIDPAVYVGHAEADLAMTELFGGFDSYFYGAYNEVSRIDSGYRERRDLYNLYHLINHLNIFGGSYLHSVRAAVRKYI